MPRLGNDGQEEGLAESLLEYGHKKTRRIVCGFLDFATQGNILEIAFGLIVAAAFTNLVTSFISDILLPPLSVLLPLNANLDLKFAILQAGPHYHDLPHGYRTIEQAQADGAVVMAYGVFLNKTLNFIGLGSALYALAGLYQYLSKDPIIKHMIKCRYCRKNVNEKSLRCVNCTSWLDGREENMRLLR
ncbi:hypothetical protein DHEL01_v203508 [Diaporthe helianthi]|uniref:Large conductance mechanosensitive channel protein n=1 Tax=Diaporthe helianthi TaxID=158607 RepID=A0A2P5I6G9_DIAHE|nr:hypothetical protein DHEL01_v203508 [Diaporthe helianthi]